ncbi:hypothetical protein [Phenylobacterium soli]|uniref:hypothetical protein n=1 Tax=Phenylobacterium soli TaxID=2170551 RepID=UPI0014037DC4|nr:hypothetical protein [Phenylobacterium soli]
MATVMSVTDGRKVRKKAAAPTVMPAMRRFRRRAARPATHAGGGADADLIPRSSVHLEAREDYRHELPPTQVILKP